MEDFLNSLDQTDFPEQLDDVAIPDSPEAHAYSLTPRIAVEAIPDLPVAVVTGDPEYWAEKLDGNQGDNIFFAQGDCGLVSVANVLTMSGQETSEASIAGYALSHGLCELGPFSPESRGGTYAWQQAGLLSRHGLESNIYSASDLTYEELASRIEDGHGAIMELNLYLTEPGYESYAVPDAYGQYYADHAVCLTSSVRDPNTGEVRGFYVCDSGAGNSMKYLSTQTLDKAFKNLVNGELVITRDPIRSQVVSI